MSSSFLNLHFEYEIPLILSDHPEVYDSEVSPAGYKLSDQVLNWLWQNLGSGDDLDWCDFSHDIWSYYLREEKIHFCFKEASDAVLFKLAWA